MENGVQGEWRAMIIFAIRNVLYFHHPAANKWEFNLRLFAIVDCIAIAIVVVAIVTVIVVGIDILSIGWDLVYWTRSGDDKEQKWMADDYIDPE